VASLDDPAVRDLLEQPNYAVVSTLNRDGSVLDTVIWIDAEEGGVAINSAIGRRWPTNVRRDPRVTLLVMATGDAYNYVEIRGTVNATATGEEADEHIDRLARKYTGRDYSNRRPGEQRIKFVITPDRIRYKGPG
jgi:PPOX class probable F420-dependent enzyme